MPSIDRAFEKYRALSLIMMLTFANGVCGVLGFIYHFLIGRVLGPAEFGLLSSVLAVTLIFTAPINALNLSLIRFFSVCSSRNLVSYAVAKVYGLYSIFFVVGLIAAILILFSSAIYTSPEFETYSHWMLFYLLVSALVTFNQGFFQGFARYETVANLSVVSALLRTAVPFSFVLFFPTAEVAIVGMVAAASLTGTLGIFLMQRLKINYFDQGVVKRWSITSFDSSQDIKLSDLTRLTFASIGFLGLTNLDVLAVKYLFDENTVGIFAAASVLAKVVLFLPTGILNFIFPEEVRNQINSASGSPIIIWKLILITGVVCIGPVILYHYFSSFIVLFVYGPEFEKSAEILTGYSLALWPMAIVLVLEHLILARRQILFIVVAIVLLPMELLAFGWFGDDVNGILNVIGAFNFGLLVVGILVLFRFSEVKTVGRAEE